MFALAVSDTGLRWWRCDMSRVSGYVNDAMFAHNRSCEADESIGRLLEATSQGQRQTGVKSDVYSCLLWYHEMSQVH